MIVTIEAIGCWGEGLHGWPTVQNILRGEASLCAESLKLPAPTSLPINEQRRASQIIRLAVLCAEEACQQTPYKPEDLPVIFASSNGDGFIINRILESLTTPGRAVSPSLFHNSVHNAPAGYWMIGHHSHQPAVSLGLHDETLPAALLKAAIEAHIEQRPVLFCIYDAPVPGSLGTARRTDHAFSCAFILTPGANGALSLTLSFQEGKGEATPPPPLPDVMMNILRHNPAGHVLPLLYAIAHKRDCTLTLPYGANHLRLALAHANS